MQDYLYTAMNGARHSLASQQVHANNLANVSTSGFKQDMITAMKHQVKGAGFDTQVTVDSAGTASDLKSGSLTRTGRELDVAVQGQGFLSVMDRNGNEAYTRAGSLTLDQDGQVWTNGFQVMGAGGPLVIPENQGVSIGSGGQISVSIPGGGLAQVDQLKLVNPEGRMLKGGDGLFRAENGNPLNQDENVTVLAGHLEDSNVNAVESMVANMALSRNFDMQLKVMKAADENSSAGNKLISGS